MHLKGFRLLIMNYQKVKYTEQGLLKKRYLENSFAVGLVTSK